MVRKELNWKLQLQLFAEPEGSGDPEPQDPPTDDPKPGAPEPTDPKDEKKYSDKDIDRIIDAKFKKWEKKKQEDIDEAKRLENMTAEEKHAAEIKSMKEKLANFEKQANNAKMADAARAIFAEKEVPASDAIVNMLIADDADTTKAAVESYIELFNSEVSKQVKEKLRGTEPPAGGSNGGTLTKAQILAITNRSERQRAIKEHPELFGINK